ncbi:hypothetical protein ACFLQY_04845 [Verrucomicrobiota bacterium]
MKVIAKILKTHQYLIVPAMAILLLLPFYLCSTTHDVRPQEVGYEYLKVSSAIDQHTQSIAQKIGTLISITPNSLALKTNRYALTEKISEPRPSLKSTFHADKLQGIAFLEGQPLVFIENRVLKEGDQHKGFTIKKITPESITVREQTGKTTTVYLDPTKQPSD